MSSTARLLDANQMADEAAAVSRWLSDPEALLILHFLKRNEAATVDELSDATGVDATRCREMLTSLKRVDLVISVRGAVALTEAARRRIERTTVSLEFLVGCKLVADPRTTPHALRSDYQIEECIGRGATSFTFRAKQLTTHVDRTLKIYLPGVTQYADIDHALARRATIDDEAALPDVIEAGQIMVEFPEGRKEVLPCVALKYIGPNASTFAEFLREHENLNASVFERFVERVGMALGSIEKAGLTHGDLHDGNILVLPGRVRGVAREFWVIDFIGIPSADSPRLEKPSDLEYFRDHLLRTAVVACGRYPGASARLLLGAKVYRVLQGLRAGVYDSFRTMLEDYGRTAQPLPEDYFLAPEPEPFEWLRVEWIPTPQWLLSLFEPVPSRYETISRFGNTWISGPRGCGKSHYLRVLAFHPAAISASRTDKDLRRKLADLKYDFRRAFGILFACRLGEFRGFVPEAIGQRTFDTATQQFLKHILVLKIWNKTLFTLKEGASAENGEETVLSLPGDLGPLGSFLGRKFGSLGVVADANPMAVFLQYLAISTARENTALAVWHDAEQRQVNKLLDEGDLDEFFGVVKQTFPELAQTQFYVLVDDASVGTIHFEMQKVLNSLIRATHAHHCFKITCDKLMYTLESVEGRPLDPRHEGTYVDLGEVSTKSQKDMAVNLSEYMARVVNRRLAAAGFSERIENLLGRSQKPREFLKALSQPRRVVGSRKANRRGNQNRACYGGWNIVWSICHGSIRTLLELIEHIFKANAVTPATTRIELKAQDHAVRAFSDRQFRALWMLPSEIDETPLGRKLQDVLSAIGQVSRYYLERYDTGEEGRWYETISIERLDRRSLGSQAREILEELVKHGLLVSEGVAFSRAQIGLSTRYDMNKVFAPAFETTYRVRNHMYLSSERLAQLLVSPDEFVKRHRSKLDSLAKRAELGVQKRLFDDED